MKNEWISVKDRLPKANEGVVWINRLEDESYFAHVGIGKWDGNNWYWYYKRYYASIEEKITHWMPCRFPDPPEVKG